MEIDGQSLTGKALFDGIGKAVIRAVDRRHAKDLDMLWYLWSGPR